MSQRLECEYCGCSFMGSTETSCQRCQARMQGEEHVKAIEVARARVFELARGASEAMRHGGFVNEADAIDNAIAEYEALAKEER